MFSLFFTSCSSDFKVGADYKDITAVYALLSRSDTANYIKISKGFYSETINNLIIAQNADSLYYSNIQVKLHEMNNSNIVNTFVLPRVELHAEGFIKNSGTFADTPSYAYKHKPQLDASKTYRLEITNLSNGKVIIGETNIINDDNMIFSSPSSSGKLNFSDPSQFFSFQWNSPPSAVFYDLYMRFHYEEKNTNTNVVERKFVDLPLSRNVPPTGVFASATVKGADFMNILNSELGAAPSYISRYVDTPDLFLFGGGQELKTYIEVNSAQGGITADQIKPNYSNLKVNGEYGKDVFGIFSTRAQRFRLEIPFTSATVDSIIKGSFTKNLNIVGVSVN